MIETRFQEETKMSTTEDAHLEDTLQNPHATSTGNAVRETDSPADLESGTAAHGGQENVNVILQEAEVVGGSDNTALPAGANGEVVGDRGQLDRVVNSESAKKEYATEKTPDPGITSA
jgi:hypothetical protein